MVNSFCWWTCLLSFSEDESSAIYSQQFSPINGAHTLVHTHAHTHTHTQTNTHTHTHTHTHTLTHTHTNPT